MSKEICTEIKEKVKGAVYSAVEPPLRTLLSPLGQHWLGTSLPRSANTGWEPPFPARPTLVGRQTHSPIFAGTLCAGVQFAKQKGFSYHRAAP